MRNALILSFVALLLMTSSGMAVASTAEHSEFEELQGPFASGHEAT